MGLLVSPRSPSSSPPHCSPRPGESPPLSHEEFLAAGLQRKVAAREPHGGEGRIRTARFPSRKSLEEFDFDHQRSLKRDTITHLGTLDFIAAKENVVFLGPPVIHRA